MPTPSILFTDMPKVNAFSRERLFTLRKRKKYTRNALKIKDIRINAAVRVYRHFFSLNDRRPHKTKKPAVTLSRFCSSQKIIFPTVVTGLSIFDNSVWPNINELK